MVVVGGGGVLMLSEKSRNCSVNHIKYACKTTLFSFLPPPTTKKLLSKISENRITKRVEYKPESFKFTFIISGFR